MKLLKNELGLESNVTIEFIWELFLNQNRKCALSGVEIGFKKSVKREKKRDETASLDRIDSLKAYTEDNVQWVHKDINKMKWDFPVNRFLELTKLVYEHSIKQTGPANCLSAQ